MAGEALRANLQRMCEYDLRTEEELRQVCYDSKCKVQRPIDGLAIYSGWACTYNSCGFYTRRLQILKYEYLSSVYGKKVRQYRAAAPL